MAKIPNINSRTQVNNVSTTGFFPLANGAVGSNATESNVQRTIRTAGIISKYYVFISANTITATTTYRTRIGAVNGAQTVSFASTVTGVAEDTSNTDTLSAGNLLNSSVVVGGTGTSITVTTQGVLYDATTNSVYSYYSLGAAAITTATTTFSKINTQQGGSASESAIMRFKMKTSGTIKNYSCNVSANTWTGTTTIGNRLNSGNGAISISIATTLTGFFEDTSNSNALVSGDLINNFITTAAGSGSITPQNIFSDIVTTNSTAMFNAAGQPTTYVITTQKFEGVGGRAQSVTEAQCQSRMNVVATTSQYEVYIVTNTISAASTFKIRKGGVDGSGSVSVTASTTGWFEDTSNSDTWANSDLINWSVNPGGAGTSMIMEMLGCKIDASVAGGVYTKGNFLAFM